MPEQQVCRGDRAVRRLWLRASVCVHLCINKWSCLWDDVHLQPPYTNHSSFFCITHTRSNSRHRKEWSFCRHAWLISIQRGISDSTGERWTGGKYDFLARFSMDASRNLFEQNLQASVNVLVLLMTKCPFLQRSDCFRMCLHGGLEDFVRHCKLLILGAPGNSSSSSQTNFRIVFVTNKHAN